jgi:hypothetical protein
MNLTSLITLPARLGYSATRRTLDLAAGARATKAKAERAKAAREAAAAARTLP